MLCVLCIASSCKKDQVEIARLDYENAADSLITITVDSALALSPRITAEDAVFEWSLNDKQVATGSNYIFKPTATGEYILSFTAANAAGKKMLTYRINVLKAYNKGVLFLSYTDASGLGDAQLSYLGDDGTLEKDVFPKVNPRTSLSASANNIYYHGGQYFITSDEGPNDVTVVDAKSLRTRYVISQPEVTNVTFFVTTDGKTGYVSDVKRRGLFPVDLIKRSISAEVISGTQNIPLIPISKVNNTVVMPVAKTLVKIDGGKASVINAYKENVAGLVDVENAAHWLAVQGSRANKAKFIKLDANYKGVDSVELGTQFKIPANGILTASGADEYIYWQETSSGDFCRFNTRSKTAEVFVNPWANDILFATSWKVDPRNGDLYIADSPGIFMGEAPTSTVLVFDKTGVLKKKVENAGFQITDMVFPR